MWRGFIATVLAMLLLFSTAYSEPATTEVPLSTLSVEELLDRIQQIEAELLRRGHVYFLDVERTDSGPHVARIQERLRELGFYQGPISAKFDAETQKAFKRFEKANALKNDGLASREDQTTLFGESAIAVPTASPAPTVKPAETESPLYADYGALDYQDAHRYPERYYGDKVKLKGRVLQAIGSRNKGFELRLATSGSDNVVYVFAKDPGFNILEDDRLTVYATMRQPVTYTAVLGNEITLPAAIADKIILE